MLPMATSFNTAKAAPFRSCALVSGALSAAGAAAGTAACSAVVLLSKSPVPSSAVRFKPCVGDGFASVVVLMQCSDPQVASLAVATLSALPLLLKLASLAF